MTFKQLETYRSAYMHDKDNAHHLFTACLIFAKQIIGDNEPDKDDIAHAATWAAWENFNTLTETTAFGPWFVRVVKNKVVDNHRKRVAREKYETQDFRIAMPAFTPEEKDAMRLYAGEHLPLIDLILFGYTLAEAANELGITVEAARANLLTLSKGGKPNA